jgi:hypothetical protein
MPGRITSHIFQMHPEYVGVPVVNLFFDGIGDVASLVGIYLRSISRAPAWLHRESFSFIRKVRSDRSGTPAGRDSRESPLPDGT